MNVVDTDFRILDDLCGAVNTTKMGQHPSQTNCALVFLSFLEGQWREGLVGLLVGCLMSQQHDSVSQGQISTDNFMCCHTEIGVADQTFYLTQSQYTDTGLTSPSTDPIMPGAWQGSHWSANFKSLV